MPIGYDHETSGLAFIADTCEDCGEPLYFSGCDAPGCTGFGCQDCGTGCDLDFMGDDGTCAQAIAEEDQEDHDERINAERAVFGLSPIEGA
ncbi:hypothetical protein Caci_2997 [Catenulispora acidiphila DSM 44928]|uniref:Uncharacterized protein n=1 Tax=Catenulispora acidiphila (strain DSM 44928 / JCM 14897 / NBRC 102108 / NRRL B-24433 / ID139908) TaxID=479433 RepID=C7Q314_CATAD|nr:hypothetical protein [Catenulispora acidiphila]ACU71906.1 hypothetical protein Caci_2997 [Catenulispora acidiphila DSM 44928]